MTTCIDTQLWLVNERNAERIQAALDSRLVAPPRPSSIRRSVGHSIIGTGERLAADTHLRPPRTP